MRNTNHAATLGKHGRRSSLTRPPPTTTQVQQEPLRAGRNNEPQPLLHTPMPQPLPGTHLREPEPVLRNLPASRPQPHKGERRAG